MIKTIHVGDKELTLKCSALVPRLYRTLNKDVFQDMQELLSGYQEILEKKRATFTSSELEIFENIAWSMAKANDPTISNKPEEWLDSLDGVFTIYSLLPSVLELWIESNALLSSNVKK